VKDKKGQSERTKRSAEMKTNHKSPVKTAIKEVTCANCGEKVNSDKCHNFKIKDAQGFFNFRNDVISEDKIFFCYDCCPTPMPSLDEIPRLPSDPEAALEAMKKVHKKSVIISDISEEEIKKHVHCGVGRREAIHEIILERMHEFDIRSKNAKKAKKKKDDLYKPNWINSFIDGLRKRHPTWGWREIHNELEDNHCIQNANMPNTIFSVDNEKIIWIDKNLKEKILKVKSLAATITRIRKRTKNVLK